MIIDYEKINNIDISFFRKSFEFDDTHHLARQTGEHYKLLKYLSDMFDGALILDVGTNWGESAVAMCQNVNNRVITYDVESRWSPSEHALYKSGFAEKHPNLEFRLLDINKEDVELIREAKLIFIDIAHDGYQEKIFTDMLSRIGYKGYLVCDDIHAPFYPAMNPWWNSINVEKYDLSEVGHTWGTGLVNYHQDGDIQIIKPFVKPEFYQI